MRVYYALVHKERGSAFGISFPDVPNCFSAADEEDDVLEQAKEALSLCMSDPAELPAARSIQDLKNDPDVQADLEAGAFFIAVPFVANDPKNSASAKSVATSARTQTKKSDVTGKSVASAAGKILNDPKASAAAKSVAASALTQKKK